MAKIIVALFCLVALSSAMAFQWGGCPSVRAVRNLNMNSMIGLWYVIEKSDTSSSCMTYNITKGSSPDYYNLEIKSTNSYFGVKSNEKEKSIIIDMKDENPGVINLKHPDGTSEKTTVIMTDYTNHASLFSCQKRTFGHSETSTILSRTPNMYKLYLEQVRSRLSNLGISDSRSTISQKNCPSRGCHGHFRYC